MVGFDHRFDDGHAEAGAVLLAVGHEWLEEPFADLLGDAGAVVGQADLGVFGHGTGGDRDLGLGPVLEHFQGVVEDVLDRPDHLVPVDLDEDRAGGELDRDLGAAEDVLVEELEFLHQDGEVDDLEGEAGSAPGEFEELLGHHRDAGDLGADHLADVPGLVVLVEFEQQLGGELDRLEGAADVVDDAVGHLADQGGLFPPDDVVHVALVGIAQMIEKGVHEGHGAAARRFMECGQERAAGDAGQPGGLGAAAARPGAADAAVEDPHLAEVFAGIGSGDDADRAVGGRLGQLDLPVVDQVDRIGGIALAEELAADRELDDLRLLHEPLHLGGGKGMEKFMLGQAHYRAEYRFARLSQAYVAVLHGRGKRSRNQR